MQLQVIQMVAQYFGFEEIIGIVLVEELRVFLALMQAALFDFMVIIELCGCGIGRLVKADQDVMMLNQSMFEQMEIL